jgi:hypothetical protein
MVAESEDGKLLVYTDRVGQSLGFVDIIPLLSNWDNVPEIVHEGN